ncbi:hypothetical protein [Chromobacterium haemolyticum]|uniref:hypothetical protein n=1 Tax=Chromobacterium haemolyticum TaxID=394935 RepID=UPI001315B651|nr:hypothetical protein [Chromobacterium haemolyticum]BBH11763.1 hypothetical protein CH06BL_10110 [Chromobacterium haemolyticum]
MTYTPEPWSISDAPYQIVGPVGQTIAKLTSLDMDNACRIVAAVNAVAGMPQDDLEELARVEGGVMSLTVYADDMRQRVEKLEADYAAQGLALKAAKAMQAGETERADRAEAQRDKLLNAIKPFINATLTDDGQIIGLMREDFERAREASVLSAEVVWAS